MKGLLSVIMHGDAYLGDGDLIKEIWTISNLDKNSRTCKS